MAAKKTAQAKKPAATKAPARKAAPKAGGARPKGAATKAAPKAKAPAAKAAHRGSNPAVKPTAKPTAKPAAKPAPKAAAKPAAKSAVRPAPKAVAAAPKAVAKPAPKPVPTLKEVAKPAPAKALPVRPAAVRPSVPAAPVRLVPARPLFRPLPADSDEEGPDTSLSLLSGPRNVKPYLAKKGEQYMSKEQLEHFRQILRTWKRDLMVEVDRTVTHMKDEAANPPDPNDRATLESEFSLELRTRDRERKLIRKIDEALARIEDGSYGYCLETGEEIGIKRLEARPVATLSIEAQERRERREKQYGDRDDRYR